MQETTIEIDSLSSARCKIAGMWFNVVLGEIELTWTKFRKKKLVDCMLIGGVYESERALGLWTMTGRDEPGGIEELESSEEDLTEFGEPPLDSFRRALRTTS
jgi:hypothetical protein